MNDFIRRHLWQSALAAGAFVVLVIVLLFVIWPKNKITPVRKGTITETVYALGTVKSDYVFKVKVAIPMGVKTVAVKEGDQVKKGQLLLASDSGISFKAPFAGTITSLTVNPGELVVTGMQLLVLQDLDRLYVEYSLDQESALRVRPDQRAELSFESLRGQVSHGIVEKVYPNAGQFIVRIKVNDLPSQVLPDMTADTAIEVAQKENVLLIPLAAINNQTVRRIRNSSTATVSVKLGIIDEEWAELIEGDIAETDKLVIPKDKVPKK